MNKLFASLLLVLAIPAGASTVAVVDSGTDFQHETLAPHAWVNVKEIAGNFVDDDHNGKVDDINGWNFIDGRGDVFFPQHLTEINPIAYKLIEIIAHNQAGTATAEEKAYWNDKIVTLPKDQKDALVAHLEYFGTYAHSTHCTGIVVQQNPKAKVMSARVFPDEPPDDYTPPSGVSLVMPAGMADGLTRFAYQLLAAISNGSFQNVSLYLKEKDVSVANYSLGMSLQTFAKLALGLKGNKTPTPAQLAVETQKVFKEYDPVGRKWMAASPNTLFVVAAGNDGSDNDVMPSFPANIRVDNEITVAAIHEDGRLAVFSNYGATTVDVAAPGVAVISTVPSIDQKGMLPMSGTSMAAPYVTGVASRVKDENPKLTPGQIRKILMGTVDIKPQFKGKVVSGGMVNPDRAATAAHLSMTTDLDKSIAMARTQIADRPLPAAPPTTVTKALTPGSLVEASQRLVF